MRISHRKVKRKNTGIGGVMFPPPHHKPLQQPRIFDTDGDGVPDLHDCAPWNKNKQGIKEWAGKVKEKVQQKMAESQQRRAEEKVITQQRQKATQAAYLEAKETEGVKLVRFRAEQERKREEERFRYRPRPEPKPGQAPPRQGIVGSVFGGLNVPPARDMFGNLLYPQQKPPTQPVTEKVVKKRKKKGKKKKRAVVVYV